MHNNLKNFWVQKSSSSPVRSYADFFSAERYALKCLSELKGKEITIMYGFDDNVSKVAYCRFIFEKQRKKSITYIFEEWSSVINLSIKRLEYKSKKNIRKNYKFIDSHLQSNLFEQ